ncbi:hypothetical protein LWI29_035930 [Acer saccharum]|uniref:Uncharacterized protein n=1 Tax=Acer saccharum TaxID=4024 RepID=A0AA39TK17_ACESA|nr:hypothetical protein LWI29_035930 [Acer saccharum]
MEDYHEEQLVRGSLKSQRRKLGWDKLKAMSPATWYEEGPSEELPREVNSEAPVDIPNARPKGTSNSHQVSRLNIHLGISFSSITLHLMARGRRGGGRGQQGRDLRDIENEELRRQVQQLRNSESLG